MDKSLFSLKGIKPTLVTLTVLTILQGFMIIAQAFYLADSISSLFGGDLFQHVFKKIIYFFIALVMRQVIVFLKRKIAYRFATDTSVRLRELLLKKLFKLGPRFVSKQGSGQTVTLVMEGTIKYKQYLELFLPKLINIVFIPALVCLFIFYENIRSGIILIIAFPILVIFMIILGMAARDKADRQYESYKILSNHFVDSLRGLDTLKYLGLSRKHIKKIQIVSEQYRKATMSTLRIAFLSTFALDFFTMLSIATVAVFLGIGLIHGTMELKMALTVLVLAPEYFLPIREVGMDYHATLEGKEAGETIRDILKQQEQNEEQTPIASWQAHNTLTVKNISFSFSELKINTLENINFSVTGMKKIGIIGASGAGKSTLIDLLSGFLMPTEGEFLINRKAFNNLSIREWQKQLTYIPQHPFVFSDSVLNNIRFYHPSATFEQVENAADAAGLTEVIHHLPNGFQTLIGEGGHVLSGGQEQRIAIARAYLGHHPIIMLDEPTAHLDIETEYEIKKTMLDLFRDKLVFIATHRLHWMMDMDQIIVLDQGRMVETGTHDQLLKKHGYYYRLLTKGMEEGE